MTDRGQATLEFVVAMIAVMFLLYGMVQVFRWVGMDIAQRRWASNDAFNRAMASGNMEQLKSDVYHPSRINASPGVDLGQ